MKDYEQIRNDFIRKIMVTEREVMEGKIEPSTPQEIPELFEDFTGTARAGVRAALWIAKKYHLIPQDSPLRQVWYSFVKLTLQKINEARLEKGLKEIKGKENTYYDALADIIGESNYWYSDFNILNDPAGFQHPDIYSYAILFPNVMIALEKESYFGAFKNFCDLLGLSLYAGGGQPSKSASETVAKKIHELFPDERLNIYTISDYDPAGFVIANTFKEHMNLYLDRYGQDVRSSRVAPYPEHYTPDELARSLYKVSKPSMSIWTDGDGMARTTREAAGIDESEGMEVESLPAELLPHQVPTGLTVNDAVGNARMRVIIFDKLMEDFDFSDALEKYMNRYFITSPDADANEIVSNASGLNEMDNKAWDLYYKVNEIGEILKKRLKEDEEKLGNDIREWRDQTVSDWTHQIDKLNLFENELRKSVVKNEKQNDFRYNFGRILPGIPNKIKDWQAPDDVRNAIDDEMDYIDRLLLELDDRINELSEEEED